MTKKASLFGFFLLVLCCCTLRAAPDWLMGGSLLGGSSLFSSNSPFLPPEQAFQPTLQKIPRAIQVSFRIEPGYYLYKERFHLSSQDIPLVLKTPKGIAKVDVLGRHEVYEKQVEVQIIPQEGWGPDLPPPIILTYQGCARSGYCYPPMHFTIPPDAWRDDLSPEQHPASPSLKGPITDGFWRTIFQFLGLGILLSFTPCSWPMLPILSGLIVGTDASRFKALGLSLTYVLAMSVTQGLIGFLMAYLGYNLQAYLQHPVAIGIQVLLLIALATGLIAGRGLSILPPAIEDQIRQRLNGLKKHGFLEAGLAGVLGTLILTPCTSAPLIGVITYLAQSGDPTMGAAALFALGFGTGIPLILVGTSLGFWLPRAGHWLNMVAEIMAVAIIAFALSLLERIWPPDAVLWIWGAFFIFLGAHLGLNFQTENTLRRWLSGISLCAMLYGALLFVGATFGHQDFWHPLKSMDLTAEPATSPTIADPTVTTGPDLSAALQKAAHDHYPVIVDFSAEWCAECVLFERTVWSQTAVQQRLKQGNILFLKADITHYNANAKTMMRQFQIFAPPTLIFYNENGQEIKRLFGSVNTPTFLRAVDELSS